MVWNVIYAKICFMQGFLFQPQNKPGLVIPMGPGGGQPMVPTPQNLHNIQVKTVPKAPPIHIKQEGGNANNKL